METQFLSNLPGPFLIYTSVENLNSITIFPVQGRICQVSEGAPDTSKHPSM